MRNEHPLKKENKEDDFERLKERLRAAYRRDLFGTHEKVTLFVKKLRDAYPDLTDYELYHLLAQSTPREETKKEDLPGEDSIVAFIQSLS